MTSRSDKTVLITGGTKGLGLATARKFAEDGVRPLVTYRSDDKSAEVAVGELRKLHGDAVAFACDLSVDGAADRMFDQVEKHTNRIDFYIHNAAATAFKSLMDVKAHHVDKTFNITVKAFIRGVQRAVPLMPDGGHIVAVSGMDTLRAVHGHGLLGGAKGALEILTRYFAHELASRNIRANCVNPGFLATDSTRLLLGEHFDKVQRLFAGLSPLKRDPQLEEVAAVIRFLCSNESSWVVGQTINVDGGQDFSVAFGQKV